MPRSFALVLFLALAASGACRSDGPAPATSAPAAAAAPSVGTLEGAYEAVRAALVADDLAAARRAAEDLAKTAGGDEALAAAAHGIGTASEIEAARLAFGEASRLYLGRLAADPALAKGKYAFRCPMAKGYKKWVQLHDRLDNPYMGQRMLECGGPVALEP